MPETTQSHNSAAAMSLARMRVTVRGVQIALGLVWLLDGLFQFKSFMFTHALITEVFGPAMKGQPSFVGDPMNTFDNFYGRNLTLWNSLSGEIQVAIGLGMICGKRLLKPALAVSFLWAPVVWWFGEGFGGLTANTLPSPLMGAPGAVILYAIVGLLVWPTDRQDGSSPVSLGPLGDNGARYIWSGMWVMFAGLWLANVNRAKEATHEMIKGMAEASPHWLAKIQEGVGKHTVGHGSTIAIVLAVLSLAIAAGVWNGRLRTPALAVAIVVSLAYWLLGQSLGGPFWAEGATDFNSGPLLVLLAVALMPIAQRAQATRAVAATEPALPAIEGARASIA
jgi:hypothetical protein